MQGLGGLGASAPAPVPVAQVPNKGKGKETKSGFSKGREGGYGGKGKAPPMPIPPPLDRPEDLPEAAGSEAVAFQVNTGTPWQIVGPQGGNFRWDLQDRDAVSDDEKREIREILGQYAEKHGISLRNGVKLALRRGQYWVSYAGGISS